MNDIQTTLFATQFLSAKAAPHFHLTPKVYPVVQELSEEGILPTPAYVLNEAQFEKNARLLAKVKKQTGAKVILALKAFSGFCAFPVLKKYLDGTTASSLNEARLAAEEFGKEVHVYSPAYLDRDFDQILGYANHISFNSFSQWKRFRNRVVNYPKKIHPSIRINPEFSVVKTSMYNPCSPFSRLGVTASEFEYEEFEGIEGLHFHALCEQNSEALGLVLEAVEKKFEPLLHRVKWVNFGGGHLITKADYDVNHLCQLISNFKKKYNVQVILEPGEAVSLGAGVLVSSVVDIIHNEMDIVLLDTSASAHMPDVIEMPYRPEIVGSGKAYEKPYTYKLGGLTCLSGDIIGDYSFDQPLKIGQKLIFNDMAHYTMCKNTTFNGISLPAIGLLTRDNKFKLIKEFGYEDFRNRLS